MASTTRTKDTDDAWDNRELGADDTFAATADSAHEAALDSALELQSIAIRLPKQLIDQYKLAAHFHKVGYQPLMRDVLSRWIGPAIVQILEAEKEKVEKASEQAAKMDHEESMRKAA